MSHVVAIEALITDLDALEAACAELGLELVRNQKSYKWYGTSVGDFPLPTGFTAADLGKCEHAIRVKGTTGGYEIGVAKRRDGQPGYTLIYDFWGPGKALQDRAGDKCSRLVQEYTAARVVRGIRGARIERTMVAGKLRLQVTR